MGRRELRDEVAQALAVVRINATELRAAQSAARRHEVASGDLVDVGARLEQLCDASPKLAAHSGHKDSHAQIASGRRCGNRMTSRIDVTPAINITTRPMPIPSPPHGGSPY